MNAIRRHPFFSAWIACCVVLVAGGLVWLQRLRQGSRHELAGLARKIQQREQLLREAGESDPAPAAGLATDQPAGAVRTSAPAAVPRKPLDAFIEIAAAKEALRLLAAGGRVALLPEESFGFSAYAHRGPPEDRLVAVHQQLGLARLLVEKLFAAHPDRLLAVRREHPCPAGREGALEEEADFFQLDRRLDLRVAGLFEGWAIRLEFAGQTPGLRAFLNSLADSPEPLLVRSVEAEPWLERPGSLSKFSVVVEQVWPVSPLAKSSGGAGRPASPTVWAELPAQAGTDRGSELFSPPIFSGAGPAKSAVARRPDGATQALPADDFELLAVKREPYRLQLAGYYGPAGDYTAAFFSPGSPEILLARPGHRFESLGLVLKGFAVTRPPMENDANGSGYELTARAQLWDERKQALVTLVGRERLLTDTPLAVMRLRPSPARPREFRAGDSFPDGAAICRIESIRLDPPEVVLECRPPGQSPPERRMLHPANRPAESARPDLAAAGRGQ